MTIIREGWRYKGTGNIMWLAHRISGLGVMFFLLLHVFGMSMSFFNPQMHEAMLETYKSPVFAIGELFLAACLVFHAVNGTRIALLELRPEWWLAQKKATQASLLAAVVIGVPLILIMTMYSVNHFILGKH
jgi:succinate dehydrogenase / fumarate reductase cytochrome b subunit